MIPLLLVLWSANVEPDLAGYRVSWGSLPERYQYYVETQDTFAVAMPGRYYAVQAYDTLGNYSPFSREVFAMSDSIFRQDNLQLKVFVDSCLVDTGFSVLWHAHAENWAGSWASLVPQVDWKVVSMDTSSITIEIFMPRLEKFLAKGMSWQVQFRVFFENEFVESVVFDLKDRRCKPLRIERIP